MRRGVHDGMNANMQCMCMRGSLRYGVASSDGMRMRGSWVTDVVEASDLFRCSTAFGKNSGPLSSQTIDPWRASIEPNSISVNVWCSASGVQPNPVPDYNPNCNPYPDSNLKLVSLRDTITPPLILTVLGKTCRTVRQTSRRFREHAWDRQADIPTFPGTRVG